MVSCTNINNLSAGMKVSKILFEEKIEWDIPDRDGDVEALESTFVVVELDELEDVGSNEFWVVRKANTCWHCS